MVDISQKPISIRTATACAIVKLQPRTIQLLRKNKLIKGNCLTTSKIAGINASKKVSEFIPLTHPLNIEHTDIEFEIGKDRIKIISTVKTSGKTGVEMEALTSAAISALTIYDMCKSVDKEMTIEEIKLIKKEKRRP